MNRIFKHRIEDVDFYLGVAFICHALGSQTWGNVALAISAFIWIVSSLGDER